MEVMGGSGQVSENITLAYLLTLDDGVYIGMHEVKENETFVGKDIRQLMLGNSSSYQVCGWLPKRMSDYLQRNTMGTASHYVTAFNSKTIERKIKKDAKVEVGDKLVLLRFD